MRVLTRWDQELSECESAEILLNLALWEIAGIEDETVSEFLSSALLQDRLKDVVEFSIDYEVLSASDAKAVRQVQAFYAKRSDLDLGYDRLGIAKQKFLEAEQLCKETNRLFKMRSAGEVQFLPRVERVLWHASRKIASILGDVPSVFALKLRFGPGATTQIPKRMASARAKLGHDPACSSELYPIGREIVRSMPAWVDSLLPEGPHMPGSIPLVLHQGKIAFVPKSAKEFRTIMVEPSLNTMCQAGIGSYMAGKLRRCGVDIRDQSRNQRLARKGSISGDLATVDLSSASDTIATELVYDLLGLDWACFLNRFRTGKADLEGVTLQLEKFSSMGNGFTFPLETLIFYALAWGCSVESGCRLDDVSAYGDDIILPTEAYALLLDVFRTCGFVVNTKKSFARGPFRESCGVDYYQGTDIRPVYQKQAMRTLDLFRIHNFYYRNYESSVCAYLQSFLDPSILLFGPDGYGDGHLLGEWVPRHKRKHLADGYGGSIFDTFTFKSRKSFVVSRGDRALPVYSVYLSEGEDDRTSIHGSEPTWSSEANTFGVSVPGTGGVNRISIYTFKRP